MKKWTVGVVGQGFVGGTLAQVLAERGVQVFTFDTAGKSAPGTSAVESIAKLTGHASMVFVCVPTPMKRDGSADLSIVEEVLGLLAYTGRETIAVVKSTVPPGSTER